MDLTSERCAPPLVTHKFAHNGQSSPFLGRTRLLGAI